MGATGHADGFGLPVEVDEVDRLAPAGAGTDGSGRSDRRHAARVALALVLLAPFALVAAFVVLIEEREAARAAPAASVGSAVAAAPGGVASTAGSSSTTAASVVVPSGVPDVTQPVSWQQQYLACVRRTESGNSYTAVNPSGAGGAYQIMPVTWNATAQHIGRSDLVGVPPQYATPSSQDLIAAALLEWQGPSAWRDGCG